MPGSSGPSEDTLEPTDSTAGTTAAADTTDTTTPGSTTASSDTEDTDTDDPPRAVTITDVSFDETTHVQLAPGSDNWATTWGADGNLYTTWGDGGGFGGTNQVGRVSLGFARIEGSPDDLMAANVWGGAMPENEATFEGKCYGLVSVGGSLYAWVGVQPGNQFATMRLYRSDDYAASWQDTGQEVTTSDFDGAFSHPDIISFGMDNGDAPDEYVYVYWNGEKAPGAASSDAIYLTRVPATSVDDLLSYEVFTGLAGDAAQWSSDFAERAPAYENPGAIHWVHNVVYVAGIDKYVLIQQRVTERVRRLPGSGVFERHRVAAGGCAVGTVLADPDLRRLATPRRDRGRPLQLLLRPAGQVAERGRPVVHPRVHRRRAVRLVEHDVRRAHGAGAVSRAARGFSAIW